MNREGENMISILATLCWHFAIARLWTIYFMEFIQQHPMKDGAYLLPYPMAKELIKTLGPSETENFQCDGNN